MTDCYEVRLNENVLVIRRSLFDELGGFHGLNFEPQKYLNAFLSRGSNFFVPRPEAEINPAYKQIIPYALIAFQNKVALLRPRKKSRRTATGGERLDRHRRSHERDRRISLCHG